MSASLANVLDFLTELHLAKKSYSCINSHRSMLSKSLPHIDGRPVGTHPLVMTLLKACYNLNPPRPKYNSTWNPDVVLSYIMDLGDNPSLPLAVLSQKVVVLIALACFLRVSDLASIDHSSVIFSASGAQFAQHKFRKSQHTGPLPVFTLPIFPVANICPVGDLRVYLSRTEGRRGSDNINSLFIATIAPFKGVTSNTIAHWVRSLLSSAGIDVIVFGAHSTRGAAAGVSVDSILQTGQWAHESTFARHYKRDLRTSVASVVLNPGCQS